MKNIHAAIKATTHAYIGRKSCGCAVAAAADIPGMEKETAKSVASFIRDGYAVSRVLKEEVKDLFQTCRCDEKESAQPELFAV